MEQVEVISAKYTNIDHTQVLAYLNHPEFETPIPFYLSMEYEDVSDIYKQIRERIDSGELVPDEYEVNLEALAQEIRIKRDSLLKDSDRYLLEDFPMSKEKKDSILAYRQALRDITKQESFPLSVEFPKFPL